MGLLRSILYTLRPGTLLMLLLGGSALACLLGGSTAAVVCFALWLYTLWGAYRSEGTAAEKAAGEGGEGSEAGSSVLSGVDGEEITSSLNELSDVESGALPAKHCGVGVTLLLSFCRRWCRQRVRDTGFGSYWMSVKGGR